MFAARPPGHACQTHGSGPPALLPAVPSELPGGAAVGAGGCLSLGVLALAQEAAWVVPGLGGNQERHRTKQEKVVLAVGFAERALSPWAPRLDTSRDPGDCSVADVSVGAETPTPPTGGSEVRGACVLLEDLAGGVQARYLSALNHPLYRRLTALVPVVTRDAPSSCDTCGVHLTA